MAKKIKSLNRIVAQNRKARHDYFIESTLEAGIILVGSEVKALRKGQASIKESYAGEDKGELFLFNAYIPEYTESHQLNHETRRPRKLLLKRRELNKLLAAIKKKGVTLIPLSMYFNKRGLVKLSLGIATGKHQVDKRAVEKERDWNRQKSRLLKNE
ncbi:MAG: SsrA-binding protein SmpB [Alphaproteobacteria bacterium]|jgi:SsrA-binding protein|nr:SsrA-binding protein SmpB [Alphaproteobacteria bacterium]MBT5390362.1 SsrA-binding protein SmpB [Alphaproteobacteria bacterium]MBT5540227.1 SsrA-binding protein SmpB [Alphaproteobacteria bacterium]MBT5654494.1 SsrA-binding protein SmpB [Alphaproteobacteria bacterium]